MDDGNLRKSGRAHKPRIFYEEGFDDAITDEVKQQKKIRSAMKRKEVSAKKLEETVQKKSKHFLFSDDILLAEKKCDFALHNHISSLKPFVSESTIERIANSKETLLSTSFSMSELMTNTATALTVQQPPSIVNVSMRDYQLIGLTWLIDRYDNGVSCILADEMGLGKTLQSISFFSHLKDVKGLGGPHLVVVPLSVLFNWQSEIRRFCPTLRILRIHTNSKVESLLLREQLADTNSFDVALTTYEMIKCGGMEYMLQRTLWRSVFLDEGHRIKNMNTLVSAAACKFRSRFKVVLTGTPVQNNLHETFCLLHFLHPKIFDDGKQFQAVFELKSKNMQVDRVALDAAHYLMRPFVLRRLKSEVEGKLPPKLETLIMCPLSDMQRFWIKRLLLRDSEILQRFNGVDATAGADTRLSSSSSSLTPSGTGEGHSGGGSGSRVRDTDWSKLQSLLAQLRKACNHPYLFPGAETDPQPTPTEEIVTASGKMVVMDKLLKKLLQRGHRVVLFSQYTRTLDIICDYLEMRGMEHSRLDGSTNRVMREVLITQFNKPTSTCSIFCLSTRAGGEGVNLYTADTVILFDSDWNPQVDIQAMARVHRIGQKKVVHIYRLVSQGSVEERIVQRAQKKLFLDSMVNRGSTANALKLDKLRKVKTLIPASTSDTVDAIDGSGIADNGDDDDADDDNDDSLDDDEDQDISGLSSGQPGGDDGENSTTPLEEFLIPAESSGLAVEKKKSKKGKKKCPVGRHANKTDTDGELEMVEESALMSALKFGWNSTFGVPGQAAAASSDIRITDEDIEALIDRRRGLAQPEEEIASSSSSSSLSASSQPASNPGVTSFSFSKNISENQQQSVLDFEETADLVDLRQFDGEYYKRDVKAISRLSDIGHLWSAEVERGDGKRDRVSRLSEMHVTGVGKVAVLKSNFYSLQDGEPSVFEREAKGQTRPVDKKSERQAAGITYQHQDFCQSCWDGGSLICCNYCPCSYHPECLGLTDAPSWTWSCPHHKCSTCEKKGTAVGFLFRCVLCSNAFCEDCLPVAHSILGQCDRFVAAGFKTPSNSCYIFCSDDCADAAPKLQKLLEDSGEGQLPKKKKQKMKKSTVKSVK